MASPELLGMFPWWGAANDGDPEAAKTRALAWVDQDPYPRAAAQASYVAAAQVPDLLQVVRAELERGGVDDFAQPAELEAYLRGLLRGCAVAYTARSGGSSG